MVGRIANYRSALFDEKLIERKSMTPELFFQLFISELKQSPQLQGYYKFLSNKRSFEFRKAYFIQRLQYISKNLINPLDFIWDCGCGYGTTCLFLAMNGYRTYGSTLEFYFQHIENRKKFWSQHGDISLFEANYENIFDPPIFTNQVDVIILQDTLHHLEPLSKALSIFHQALKQNGMVICVEENGSNIIQQMKLFIQRGNNTVINYYDKELKKTILFGNENIRSLQQWKTAFYQHDMLVEEKSVEYIRLFPPLCYNGSNSPNLISRESLIWKKNPFLRKYFFFGLHFLAKKQ